MNNHPRRITRPIFLVGAERSGTTLLRLMLDHHPKLSFHHEFEFAVDQMHGGEFPELEHYKEFLETDRIFQSTGFSIDPDLSYPELIESFLCQKDRDHQPQFLGATVHRDFDRLVRIWPDARFIHIVRDPRDVAQSCIGMNWAGNTWAAVERWLDVENLWDSFELIIPTDAKIEVHYEDLVGDPIFALRRLCKFIGVDYDAAIFSYANSTSYDLPQANLAYQWQRKMTHRDIQLVEAKVSHLLNNKGYTGSGLPALKIGKLTRWKLKIHNALTVKTRRIGIYGFPLVASSWLSQFLRVEKWQKNVMLKCNEIDTSMLK